MKSSYSFLDVSKIAMEYAEMGDLHRYLRRMRTTQNASTLDEGKVIDYGKQIAKGMQFVASKGVGVKYAYD